MRIDFHSHILPGMDDGAADTTESLAMLRILADAKVDVVVLTPHFYRDDENIQSFLKRRAKAYERLVEAIGDDDTLPRLVLGAEVLFTPSLSSDPDFEKLKIENTDYILLELPFEHFYDNFYSNFTKFLNRCEPEIILAHIERYLRFGNSVDDLHRIVSLGDMTCQMNCSSIANAGFFDRKKIFGLIEEGLISAIGTDAHNLTTRPPMYKKAEEQIRKRCGDRAFDRICYRSEEILNLE